MDKPELKSTYQPFPLKRPEVQIEPSVCEPFILDLDCVPGWGVMMERGAQGAMAWYDPPDWTLTSVSYLHVPWRAQIHGLDGLEIEGLEWERGSGVWQPGLTQFARLTEQHFEWLATSRFNNDQRVLYTFLDEGFDEDWERVPRRIEDQGRLTQTSNGYRVEIGADAVGYLTFGAGIFEVTIGEHTATCLRSVDVIVKPSTSPLAERLEQSTLVENYYTRQGRLFLFRRYNGRTWGISSKSPIRSQPWDKRFPGNTRFILNDATFVHWYDCLTDSSVGISGEVIL